MPWSALFSVFLAAACSCWLLRTLIPHLHRRLLDKPNARSSHVHPTPRGGGLAFVLVASVASVLSWLVSFVSGSPTSPLVAVPLLVMPLAFVGFLDDLHNIPVSWRYFTQSVTALLLIFACPRVSPSFVLLPLLASLLIAVTAVINFTNFMDGLDGLVAGCMSVAFTTVAIKLSAPWTIWALVGALLGFLVLNWSPAKVFMGDVGSTFLGAVFAELVLQAPSWSEGFALLLVATPLLGDACLCVLRRLIAGQRVLQAHRLHLYQRLHQAGWPHAHVSTLYIGATAVLATSLLWGGLSWVITFSAVELLIGIWLDQRVAVPFALATRS